ncbi:taste receptor type 2 member 42 [Carlito syrichta]|uniref:Taste receptor type 2 n=1 Tax=Carlito syrichta TaxID=1868482 RepID=A0A1U7T8K1_CARSF|nr:taste receptor type 2 member 42 [Carlito syrichta]
MFTGLDEIFVILAIVEFILGMLGNVFIGLVNCLEWVKNQKVSSADFILTCLAVFRISQLLVVLFDSCILALAPRLYITYRLAKSIGILWRISNHLTTWLATCLSIFYFFKIAYFPNSFFLWLRWRMNRVIVVLLIFSLLLLIFEYGLLEMFTNLWINIYKMDQSNLTLYLDESKTLYIENLTLLSVTYLIPFALSLTSLLLLFLSLGRHTRSLELNSMGSSHSRIEAHKRAIKTVMSFLFLFIVHFFSTQVANWIFPIFWTNKYTEFILLALNIFPSGHSFILILGNSKLRQTALKVLWHFKNHLKRSNS